MKLSKENIREKEFHNKLQSGEGVRSENKFYKAIFNLYRDFESFLKENSKDKIILDYGCGIGSVTEQIARHNPSKITGFDISEVSIEKAISSAKKLNLEIEYKVDNCEKSSFDSEKFDIIYGSGILHHLDLNASIKEINRLLKKNGKMIFVEPLGTNPFINVYRNLTPKSRSEDEHPFSKKDFDSIKNIFEKVTVKYYGFFTLIFCPFYKRPEKSLVYKFCANLDEALFKIKFFRFLAWSVLIVGEKS